MRLNLAFLKILAGVVALNPTALAAQNLSIASFSAGSAECEDYHSDVAASHGGSFLLVWSRQCGPPILHLVARLYDAEARPIGPEIDRMTQNGTQAELIYAATTNGAMTIQVTDRQTGQMFTSQKPAGRFASGRIERLGNLAAALAISETAALATNPPLGLFRDRFKVEVTRTGADGTVQPASGALFDDRRAAYRFGEDLSLTVALIDGRASNGKFWVYLGDLSDAAHRVRITDNATGKVKVYTKPAGRLLTRVDRQAF